MSGNFYGIQSIATEYESSSMSMIDDQTVNACWKCVVGDQG